MQSIKTAGIENVRQHLGHSSISSTGEYLKVSDNDASAAVNKGILASEAPAPAASSTIQSEVQQEIARQLAELVRTLKKRK
jgi:hypothetical protein